MPVSYPPLDAILELRSRPAKVVQARRKALTLIEVTQMLEIACAGKPEAAAQLLPLVY